MNRRSTLAVLVVGLAVALTATASTRAGQVIFVDDDRPANGDGQTWASAYRYLQDALTAARNSGGAITEVWVAAGTYCPDRDAAHPNGTKNRNSGYSMIEGVAIRGGFAGNEDPATFDLGDRVFTAHPTVLSGDLLGNDSLSSTTRSDNSVALVGASDVGATSVLDGFVITGAEGGTNTGAIFCYESAPTILNNTITGNTGSGVRCATAWATISRNRIIANSALAFGGGIYCNGGAPIIANNVISGNTAGFGSGVGARPCGGAGIYCDGGSTRIISNLIADNVASGPGVHGGGIFCNYGSGLIANNTIVGNIAIGPPAVYSGQGGGLNCVGGSTAITNNTIVANRASQGGGIACDTSYSAAISNNIVAFNSSGIRGAPAISLSLSHNCVYNPDGYDYSMLSPGDGDFSADPLLLAAKYRDFHLLAGSPCINAGDSAAVQPDMTDLDGEFRVQADRVDIGTDEFNGAAPPFIPKAIRVSPSGHDSNDGLTWPTAKLTIQNALDTAAITGAEVWAAAATYHGILTLKPTVHLLGGFTGTETDRDQRDWAKHATILDGNAQGSVVTVQSGGASTAIDGFIIRGGTGTPMVTSPFYGLILAGGGISCDRFASPNIVHCTITANTAERGGGINSTSGLPTISDCTITKNTATESGGGIYCDGGSPVITQNSIAGNIGGGIVAWEAGSAITHNRICWNTAESGGGIRCVAASGGWSWVVGWPATIANNIISCNAAIDGKGGGIALSGAVVVINNLLVGNSSSEAGGAVACTLSTLETTITGNTIFGNTVPANKDHSGGIYSSGGVTIANNIIAANSSGIHAADQPQSVRNNCVYNPDGTEYGGLISHPADISVDPQFLAPERGDFHLVAGSPCIDAGHDAAIQPDWVDMDAQGRLYGAHVDIGADEFIGTTPLFAPPAIRVSTAGDDANDGLSWASAKRSVQAGIEAATLILGSEVWVASGTYNERIALKPWVHVLGGFAGVETARDQRDWLVHETILDGGAAGSVVTATSPGRNSGIDGFTIRNGSGYQPVQGPRYGGGIYCANSSPTIANNLITTNRADYGGGIFCTAGAAPTLSGNTITGNQAANGAGIGCTAGAAPLIANNTITANGPAATACLGGGIYCASASPTISGNLIALNTAGNASGGGLHLELPTSPVAPTAPLVLNNTLAGNSATIGGGAYIHGTLSPTFANNLFVGNQASVRGGGLSAYATIAAVNCTFVGNAAPNGTAMHTVIGTSTTLTNSILWNNAGPMIQGTPIVTFCDIEGGWAGTGNMNLDPRFVRLPSPGPDNTWGTADDDYGDLRLQRGSPGIDAGKIAALPAGVLTDRDGRARFVDDPDVADCPAVPGTCGPAPVVDLGAYELMDGDFNNDGRIDVGDFAAFMACFTGPAVPYVDQAPACTAADFDGDADVDQADFGSFQRRLSTAK